MYLLAWPLVCSTTTSGFAHGSSLGPAENLLQRNATQTSSFFSSSVAYQQHQQQRHRQEEQEHEEGHRRRWYEERKQRETEMEESSYQGHQAVIESDTLHPYNEYSWEVNQINPWLSACDLAGPAPADLQGSCGPPEVPKNCPTACSIGSKETEFLEVIERNSWPESSWNTNKDINNNKMIKWRKRKNLDGVRRSPEQCLFYLEESHKRDICRDDFGRSSTRSFLTPRENRYWFMSGLRLRHCCEHAVVNALAPGKAGPLENVLNGGQKCADALDKLLLVDALAARLHCEFEEVLARYDCAQPYSVIFNCTHCKEAYRKWVCSSLVPYFAHGGPQDLDSSDSWAGSRLRPCRSFCQSVEQRCPYLLPGDRAPAYPTQYAGEPTFLCRDPNIPETGEQAARALHSSEEDECCFHACSEEDPASGICANCTNREPRKRDGTLDPPTAPFCEINPIQPASTGVQYGTPGTTDSIPEDGEEEPYDSSRLTGSSGSLTGIVQQQGASLCGSGAVGSMTSVSSSDRSTIGLLPQLFWLCSLLTGNPVLRFSRIVLLAIGNGYGNSGNADLKTKCWWLLLLLRVERRRDGRRWCCWCWCWWWCWWRRFRRISLYRWKLPRRIATTNRISPFHGPDVGGRGSFVSKCRWRRWNWWWWWLYRWWTFCWTSKDTVQLSKRKRRRRGRSRRRRRRDRWRRKRRSKGCLDVFCNDVWHCSATRRYFRLSSRKDPP